MPRRIITASENETVRKTNKQDVDLMAIGIIHAVAILIKDSHGNASLTQVGASTNLDFLQLEIQQMQGNYTLDIIQAKPNIGEPSENALSLEICKKLRILGLSNLPATKNKRVHDVKHNAVLLRDDKMFQPQMSDIIELSSHLLPGSPAISARNSLRSDTLESCGHNPTQDQGDVYITQINGLFSNSLPKITHDATGWHRTPTLISQEAKSFMAEHTIESLLDAINNNSIQVIRMDAHSQVDSDPFKSIRKSLNYILPKLERNREQQKQVAEMLGHDPSVCPWIREISYFMPVATSAHAVAPEGDIPVATAYRL